jgi:hypothetical protein
VNNAWFSKGSVFSFVAQETRRIEKTPAPPDRAIRPIYRVLARFSRLQPTLMKVQSSSLHADRSHVRLASTDAATLGVAAINFVTRERSPC